ncbi:FecR family protein [Sphingomonas colocasiae]|uniref:FecR domain-containing protein n=1 Tax=Sphingomonas colocasiae TaxID=1848973 RepID=A0ABS7PPQ9_9SPHN|nr:FecR domain-containing protein [Sphingomonas colocasiae]MBY8823316.1 FecR domain-containing protein [Sphingomonas colocasiae]MBY8826451.1 FecR domain-containing protein [Sphingomonas colocasiae]
MSRDGDDAIDGNEEQLRIEAAGWFARMRRDDRRTFERDFETWLATPANRAAYNRIAARFADAKILHRSLPASLDPDAASNTTNSRRTGTRKAAIALAAASLAALCLFFLFNAWPDRPQAGTTPAERSARIETRTGQMLRVRLVDGSRVTLDAGSLANIRFDDGERVIRIERGRARFGVAHENRPFIVETHEGRVTARGTLFDVALTPAGASVALIEGAVEVAAATSPSAPKAARAIRRLAAGQAVTLARGAVTPLPAPALAATDWARTRVELRDVPLNRLLDRANRLGAVRIDADPALMDRRISGRFRLDDPRHLATTLARLLDLELDASPDNAITLRQTMKKIPPAP